jgi:hypothetical protein
MREGMKVRDKQIKRDEEDLRRKEICRMERKKYKKRVKNVGTRRNKEDTKKMCE